MKRCNRPPIGWKCPLAARHEGPCPATPTFEHQLRDLGRTARDLAGAAGQFCAWHAYRILAADGAKDALIALIAMTCVLAWLSL